MEKELMNILDKLFQQKQFILAKILHTAALDIYRLFT